MLHLPIERFAELVDADPSVFEREHLAACATCGAELEAYRRVVAMASDERRRIAPPLTTWDALSAHLRAEGLIGAPMKGRRESVWSQLALAGRRAAAVVFLVGSGLVMGRVSTGLPMNQALALGPLSGASADASRNTANDSSNAATSYATTDDALAVMRRAQSDYERAVAYLATHDTSTSENSMEQYRTRLAALDAGMETFGQALREAPQDPVLNQYYLATLGAREATLSKLGTVLPTGARLSRF
jgi:hypothetical protein